MKLALLMATLALIAVGLATFHHTFWVQDVVTTFQQAEQQ